MLLDYVTELLYGIISQRYSKELCYRFVSLNYITELHYGIILQNHIMELYYRIGLMEKILENPEESPELSGTSGTWARPRDTPEALLAPPGTPTDTQ